MSSIMIKDLPHSCELGHRAMTSVRGGTSYGYGVAGLGALANVNVNVNQNIDQYQNVQVAALNNVGIIGAGFVAPSLNVSPTQWASTHVLM